MTFAQPNSIHSKLHPVVKKIFNKRDYTGHDIRNFLSVNLAELPDLSNLLDIDKASKRIISAVENSEEIGIYGDYDVDGTTSCALLYHFFKMLNIEVSLFQPNRLNEGYGLHLESIDKAHKAKIKLLITVDCGITAHEAALHAVDCGIDLIITDHHLDSGVGLPDACAVINPNRHDEPQDSPLRNLAGVGVAFALCLKIRNDLLASNKSCPSIYPLLQFVAIGTICDMAKLSPVNLKLVRHGLNLIKKSDYPGIRVFFPPEERERSIIPSEKLSFSVGPLINSKGRLGHPEIALNLLISNDSGHAYECYNQLTACNNERKFIQAQVVKEAIEQILNEIQSEEHPINIVYDPSWHEGVIGIVASKLVDNFKIPAIVFTDAKESGIIKASARSAGVLNLYESLKQTSDLFLKFGGHSAALGLSMKKENLESFKTRCFEILQNIPSALRTRVDTYDLEINPADVTPDLLNNLELLEPFGNGNQKPLFRMRGLKLDSYSLMKDIHVKWHLSDKTNPKIKLNGVSFNYIGKWEATHPEKIYQAQNNSNDDITIYFSLGINHWGKNRYIQLNIDKITVEL